MLDVSRQVEVTLSPLPILPAHRVLWRDRSGSSSPVAVETDQGRFLVKLRGAAQGPAALVAEIIVGALADQLGLRVPARAVIMLGPNVPSDDQNDELADLLAASTGENLGLQYLPQGRAFQPADLTRVTTDWASQVRWLDWLVLNPDRTPVNPNVLVVSGQFWLIDHGAALLFHHDWSAVTEQTPGRPGLALPHVFDTAATRLVAWDPLLTSLLPRERLAEAVATVPDAMLAPLLAHPSTTAGMERRRAAYVAFLWKRLQGPRDFGLAAVAVAG